MARLSYADPNRAEVRAIVERIVAERGSVLHLYQMLLHSPPIAEGWLALLTAVRQKSALAGAVRELVIMRIAHVNGAPYEAEQHAPIALREGLSRTQLDALADWTESGEFSAAQRAVLALTDGMTRAVHIDDSVFDAARPHFSARELVELVVTIAAYNMVSRVLEALQIAASDPRDELRARTETALDQLGGLTRVNYFAGGVLGVDDFVTEQHYLRARLRRRNRYLLGSGVVDGLKVALSGGAGNQMLTIEPGLAIDGRGEEIEIASDVALPLPATGKQLLVQLNYAERLSRPVTVPGQPGEPAESQPSRVEETFRAYVAAAAKPPAVVLARLTFARSRWFVDRKFRVPRARSTVAK
jgi:AhpD family alkylhydroperoxidase